MQFNTGIFSTPDSQQTALSIESKTNINLNNKCLHTGGFFFFLKYLEFKQK